MFYTPLLSKGQYPTTHNMSHQSLLFMLLKKEKKHFYFMGHPVHIFTFCDLCSLSAVYCLLILLQNDQKYQLLAAPGRRH